MVDRYHLRYFLAVIDAGNFSRAAAACNVSQPTLSVGIAKLERQLGQRLFKRDNRRIELTEAGARLTPHARAIEAGFARAERDAGSAGSTRALRMGVLGSIPRSWIEAFLQRRRPLAAAGRIEIVEGRGRELHARLAQGRIDVALTVLAPGDDSRAQRPLFDEGYALALSSQHRLAGRPSIAAEELRNEPMIVRRHCEVLAETSRFFIARGVRPFFAAKTFDDDRALSYVRAGLGLTVMPDGFREPGVVRPRLEGFEPRRRIGLVFGPRGEDAGLHQSPELDMLADAIAAARA